MYYSPMHANSAFALWITECLITSQVSCGLLNGCCWGWLRCLLVAVRGLYSTDVTYLPLYRCVVPTTKALTFCAAWQSAQQGTGNNQQPHPWLGLGAKTHMQMPKQKLHARMSYGTNCYASSDALYSAADAMSQET